MTTITRAGMPSEPDSKAQAKFQAELAEVSHRERALVDTAQKAQGIASTLFEWAVEMGKVEDRLLVSTPLTEEDRPDVESYVRAHRRYLRVCRSWADKLAF